MKRLIIPFLFFVININAQNFQSVDTDTLYSIKDFGLRRYDRERERTLLDLKDISSNKIRTQTRIYKSQLRDGRNVESRIITHYSLLGFKTNEEWYNRDTTFREFKYDKWGNCAEELILNNRNEATEKEIKEFDKLGNLIYHYSLKNGAEKIDMINEELLNGERLVKDISQTFHTSYRFDSIGVLQEYTLSYKNTPKSNGHRRISRHEGVKIDTLFETDSGDYLERQKFFYEGDKLIMIETFEEYERYYIQMTYTYNYNGAVSIDTVKWIDNGGLKNIRLFKYVDKYLIESIDSTIKPESEIYRTRYYYDDLGRLVQKKLFEKFSNKTRYFHDSLGREITQKFMISLKIQIHYYRLLILNMI